MVLISDGWVCDVLVLVVCICLPIYGFLKHKHTYWARKGFKSYPNPNILFGHFEPTFRQKVFVGELAAQIYRHTQEPFVGIYAFTMPLLLVCDPQVARNIFITDFQYFGERTYKKTPTNFSSFIHFCACYQVQCIVMKSTIPFRAI